MTDLDPIRRRLEERIAKLERRTSKIEGDLRTPGNPDWEERATEQANDEVLEHLGASERTEIEQMRRAIARIDAGTYGSCERCGEAIDPKRLEAMPGTVVCIACAD